MIRGLEKIKTKEEYEAIKTGLKYYVKEYIWFKKSSDPIKEVTTKLQECMKKLEGELLDEEELELLSIIHSLKTKYVAIKEGKYENDLKGNITAYFLMIEEYNARMENRSFLYALKGIFGNKEARNYLKRRYMLSLSNAYGVVPTSVNLNLEKVEDILKYILEKYNFVGITVDQTDATGQDKKAETGYGKRHKDISKEIMDMTEEFLEEVDPTLNIDPAKQKLKKKRGQVRDQSLEHETYVRFTTGNKNKEKQKENKNKKHKDIEK